MKKYRVKKKPVIILCIIIVLLVVEIINPFNIIARNQIMELNYSKEVAKKIVKLGLKKETLNHDYSSFVENYIFDENFDSNYYDVYLDLENNIEVSDLTLINKLINKGYNSNEVNLIVKRGDNASITEFLKHEKYDNFTKYLEVDYAKLSNLDKYIEYKELNVVTYEETVTYINLGLDREYYTDYEEVTEFDKLMLVNKYNKLSETFVPDDLVKVEKDDIASGYTYGKVLLNKETYDAFKEMNFALKEATNYSLKIGQAYRSYKDQETLYNSYLKIAQDNNYKDPEAYVKSFVSVPGFSEHQTGLGFNVDSTSNSTYIKSEEYKWLKENCYKYGFIIRYTDRKIDDKLITGYKAEYNHLRYVGVEAATYIMNNNITLEEYYVKFLDK